MQKALENKPELLKAPIEIVFQGAEAIIYSGYFERNSALLPCIAKHRFSKQYRHPSLDYNIRDKRTKSEVKILKEAEKNGIPVPKVYYEDDKNCIIYMEKLPGKSITTYLMQKTNKDSNNNENDNREVIEVDGVAEIKIDSSGLEKIDYEVAFEMGRIIGLMHSKKMLHNDLTTSNFMVSFDENSGKPIVHIIDFGLGQKSGAIYESIAVDLYVLERAVVSLIGECDFFDFVMNGYKSSFTNDNELSLILSKYKAVRQRGRKRA